jgi:hypothetical protein
MARLAWYMSSTHITTHTHERCAGLLAIATRQRSALPRPQYAKLQALYDSLRQKHIASDMAKQFSSSAARDHPGQRNAAGLLVAA